MNLVTTGAWWDLVDRSFRLRKAIGWALRDPEHLPPGTA